ncbi:MAG: CAP domain-containing protein [Phycisphaerales bacterium JB063]
MTLPRTGWLATFLLAITLSTLLAPASSAQDTREIDIIETLGEEQVAAREAREQAAAEREHRQRLEEQSQLRQAFQEYLGVARRTATQAVRAKAARADAQQVMLLREQAREIIDRDGLTKAMVQAELDPIYERLEELLVPTQEQLYAVNPQLLELRRRIAPGSGTEVLWIEEIAIQYALATDDREREVVAGNVAQRDPNQFDTTAGEADGIDLCNRRRMVLGLNPLAVDHKLILAGRDHSNDMVTLGFFAHSSPVPGKETPWKRAENFGTTASGENIAAGYGSETQATMGWWYSPGHLKNMMGQGHNRIGLGTHQQHYTQLFGR